MHTNKTNGKCYIGITRQKPERRWQNGKGYVGTYFGNAIEKYGWDGFEHEIIREGLSEKEACELEIKLINEHKSNDHKYGYNISEGGQTCYCKPKYGRENPKSSPVIRINPTTGEKKYYDTISSASKEMNINHRGISKACNDKCSTYKGYIWEYEDGHVIKREKHAYGNYDHKKIRKRISFIDVDGSEKSFDSYKDASEYVGVRPCTISRYVNGVRNDSSGRRWLKCLSVKNNKNT